MLGKGRWCSLTPTILRKIGNVPEMFDVNSSMPTRLLMYVGGEYTSVSCSIILGKSGGKISGLIGCVRSILCPLKMSIVYLDPLVKTMGGAKAPDIYLRPFSKNWSDSKSGAS